MKKIILLIIVFGSMICSGTAQHSVFLRPDGDDEKILSGCTPPLAISDLNKAILTDPNASIDLIQENITITPNPFSHTTTIKFNNPKGISYSLQLFDMRGILVKHISNIKNNFVVIEKESLSPGMYIFKLTSEKGNISSGKLVVE
jgi:hypothetical protein